MKLKNMQKRVGWMIAAMLLTAALTSCSTAGVVSTASTGTSASLSREEPVEAPALLTAQDAEEPWQVGLTREEVDSLLREKAAYEAMDSAQQALLREGGGVGCIRFQHLWWEESIAVEFMRTLEDEQAFLAWAKAGEDCLGIYTLAAWQGWTVEDLIRQIQDYGLEEIYPLEQVCARAPVWGVPQAFFYEQRLIAAVQGMLADYRAGRVDTTSGAPGAAGPDFCPMPQGVTLPQIDSMEDLLSAKPIRGHEDTILVKLRCAGYYQMQLRVDTAHDYKVTTTLFVEDQQTIREEGMAQALKNGLTQEQAQSLENLSYRWEEIARMTPAQAEEKLAEAKELYIQNQLAELQQQWQDWGAIAAGDPRYVLATSSGGANIASLDAWVEDFQNRREGDVYVLIYGSPSPIAYRLACEGGDDYRVDYYLNEELNGGYTSSIIYRRTFDYIFGEPEVQHLKGPLTVPRAPMEEQLLSQTPQLDDQALSALEAVVWDTKVRLDGLVQLRSGVNSGGILLPKDNYADIEHAYHRWGYGQRISFYGRPCQVIGYFQSDEQQTVESSGDRYAISEDGRLILLQSMVDGAWIPLEDRDAVSITAR